MSVRYPVLYSGPMVRNVSMHGGTDHYSFHCINERGSTRFAREAEASFSDAALWHVAKKWRHIVPPKGEEEYVCRALRLARRRLPRGQSPWKGWAVGYCVAYRITKIGLAGVIVAVPPRLDFTVTTSGFTRTEGVTLVF